MNDKPIDTNTGNNNAPIDGALLKPSPAQDAVDNMKHLVNMMEFIDTVQEMRTAQKSFFKTRNPRSGATQKEVQKWLDESKRTERMVDDYLIKFKERNSPQTKLF